MNDDALDLIEEMLGEGSLPDPPLVDAAAAAVVAPDVVASGAATNVLQFTPADIQGNALRSLISESNNGSVPASVALIKFTEDQAVAMNEDLRNMTAAQLADESRQLAEKFDELSRKEVILQ